AKQKHYTKTVIVAAGNGAFQPRRLPIDGAEKFEEENLHYIVADKNKYKDAVVAICGGGDSAVGWALELESVARKVYLIHRRSTFRAHELTVSLLEKSSVEILTPFVPIGLKELDGKLNAAVIKEVRGEKEI